MKAIKFLGQLSGFELVAKCGCFNLRSGVRLHFEKEQAPTTSSNLQQLQSDARGIAQLFFRQMLWRKIHSADLVEYSLKKNPQSI